MADINYYFEMLKEELRQKFTTHLSYVTNFGTLKRGDYKNMSTLVEVTLNDDDFRRKFTTKNKALDEQKYFTISVTTLKRIFKYGYSLKLDKRIIHTLNILSLFLGYQSWDDFIEKKKDIVNAKGQDIEKLLVDLINKNSQAELKAYFALPRIETNELKKRMVSTGPAYKRIYNLLLGIKKRKWILAPTSHRDIYGINLLKLDSKTALFEVLAYWHLRWVESKTGRVRKIYNVANLQLMRLVNIKGAWKLKTNYYRAANDRELEKRILSGELKPI